MKISNLVSLTDEEIYTFQYLLNDFYLVFWGLHPNIKLYMKDVNISVGNRVVLELLFLTKRKQGVF